MNQQDMNITDNQAEAALKHIPHTCQTQLQLNVVKQMIEAATQAAWVKFDINDKSTYPPILPEKYFLRITQDNAAVVIECLCSIVDNTLVFSKYGELYAFDGLVSHWLPPHEHKEVAI